MKRKHRRSTSQKLVAQQDDLLAEYRFLVRQVIQALGVYDSDDGHNDLVLAGVVAESKRLEAQVLALRKKSKTNGSGKEARH